MTLLDRIVPLVKGNGDEGYWGEITSSVDWCEINYAISSFICEFFNSFSSVAMIFVGILGYFLQKELLEPRFVIALSTISVVGMGSVAFHMTLKHEMQMLDEVPMLWDALSTLYIFLENEHATPRYSRLLPVFLIAYGVGISLLVALTEGALQFCCFHISFGTLEFYSLYRVYMVRKQYFRADSTDPDVVDARRVSTVGFYTYLIALVAWQLDINFCPLLSSLPLGVPNPQLHAWWHVLVSVGLYDMIVFIIFRRQQVLFTAKTLTRKPSVHWLCGVIPYITLQDDLHVR